MTPEQFAYWLQGFAEISEKSPNAQEWKIIKDHLATVFKKITPQYVPGVAVPRDPYTPYETSRTPFYIQPTITCSTGSSEPLFGGAGDLK